MRKMISLLIMLIFCCRIFGSYESLTKYERKTIDYAFEKAQVYNDLISGAYVSKILKTEILKKEEISKTQAVYLIRATVWKKVKSTGEEITSVVTVPVKVSLKPGSTRVTGKILVIIGVALVGFLAGRATR